MNKKVVIVVLVLICLLSLNAFGLNGSVEGEKVSDAKYMADTLWVLVAAFLVFFMQAALLWWSLGLRVLKTLSTFS